MIDRTGEGAGRAALGNTSGARAIVLAGQPHPVARPPQGQSRPLERRQAPSRRSHILLVDDDSTAVELLAEVLSERGFSSDTCNRVEDAQAMLKAHNYHAMVTDLKMPGRARTTGVDDGDDTGGMQLLDFAAANFP